MKTLAALLLSLTLTAPAWAIDFGTSTFATWRLRRVGRSHRGAGID